MRNFLLLFIFLVSCSNPTPKAAPIRVDTAGELRVYTGQLQATIKAEYKPTLRIEMCDRSADSMRIDSLMSVNHRLQDTLFLKKAQVANCKKYLRICIKNPSQDRFLKGWIRRALDL